MKIRGQQRLSRQEAKLVYQVKSLIGKSELRSKGTATMEKHLSNAATLAKHMAHTGYQSIHDFKFKTYKSVMNALKEQGYSKSVTESMHTTCRKIAEAIGKHGIIDKSVSKAMDSKEFHRGHEDRVNPQYWSDRATRDASAQRESSTIDTKYADHRLMLQANIEKINAKYASATNMALHFGIRKEESLASRELVMKTADGKILTTAGNKEAGKYRELANDRAVRYAFTGNVKDASFEENYLNQMKPGQEYLFVPGEWAKGGRTRLVPVMNEEARAAALHHQQVIRDNQKLGHAMAKAATLKGTLDQKMIERMNHVNSIIDPDKTKAQGYERFTDVLRQAGFEKKHTESSTLHADRTEFCQRMRADKDEEGNNRYSDHDRTLAMGHGDDRKLDHYGG